jgi:predicted RNA-binding Zn-ribbon protein involved in translation (DUF1610 family)
MRNEILLDVKVRKAMSLCYSIEISSDDSILTKSKCPKCGSMIDIIRVDTNRSYTVKCTKRNCGLLIKATSRRVLPLWLRNIKRP